MRLSPLAEPNAVPSGGFFYAVVPALGKTTILMEKIDAFLGKTAGIPGLNLIYATRTGYQSGAVANASANNVRLLIIDEAGDQDWVDEDGTPLLHTIHFQGTVHSAPLLTVFNPRIDGKGLTEEQLEEAQQILNYFPPDWHIEDVGTGERYDLRQLQVKLHQLYPDMAPGKGVHTQELNNAWIVMKEGALRVRLRQYEAHFTKAPDVKIESKVNISDQLMGIVKDITLEKKRGFGRPQQRKTNSASHPAASRVKEPHCRIPRAPSWPRCLKV